MNTSSPHPSQQTTQDRDRGMAPHQLFLMMTRMHTLHWSSYQKEERQHYSVPAESAYRKTTKVINRLLWILVSVIFGGLWVWNALAGYKFVNVHYEFQLVLHILVAFFAFATIGICTWTFEWPGLTAFSLARSWKESRWILKESSTANAARTQLFESESWLCTSGIGLTQVGLVKKVLTIEETLVPKRESEIPAEVACYYVIRRAFEASLVGYATAVKAAQRDGHPVRQRKMKRLLGKLHKAGNHLGLKLEKWTYYFEKATLRQPTCLTGVTA